jgi:septal ring factor EnvC (AmiA/AmiB activator)
LLQVRLGAIYKLGGQGLARIIFSTKSSAELERNLKILGQIAKHDLGLVKDYTKSAAELSTKQQRFLNRLSQLRRVEKKIAKQEEAIGREAQQKAKVLDSIRRSKSSALAKIQSIRQQSSKFAGNSDSGSDELLDLLLRPSFFEKKGELRWPVSGRVSRGFGLVKNSEFDVVLNNKGIGIGTTAGTEVVSIFPGRVSYQGSLDGWGPTLIVDHGDHYYSVYCNLGGVFVQKGDEVLEGQKIAQATNEIYFEIRHFSEPYNPLAWMKGQHQ